MWKGTKTEFYVSLDEAYIAALHDCPNFICIAEKKGKN